MAWIMDKIDQYSDGGLNNEIKVRYSDAQQKFVTQVMAWIMDH